VAGRYTNSSFSHFFHFFEISLKIHTLPLVQHIKKREGGFRMLSRPRTSDCQISVWQVKKKSLQSCVSTSRQTKDNKTCSFLEAVLLCVCFMKEPKNLLNIK